MIYIIKDTDWDDKLYFFTRDFDYYEDLEELKDNWGGDAEFREIDMDYEDVEDMDQDELEELFNSYRKYVP